MSKYVEDFQPVSEYTSDFEPVGLVNTRHSYTGSWEEPSAVKELGRGFVEGLMSNPETVGTIATILGSKKAGPAIEKGSRAIADKFQMPDTLQGKVAEDPSLLAEPAWWTHGIGQAVGSIVGPAGVGGGAFKIAKTALNKIIRNPKTVAKAAKYLGLAAGGAAGGTMEGTSTYNQVLEETGDEQKALRSGALMAVGSAVLNSASFGSMLSPKIKSKILRVVTSGLIEGATEQAEEPWEALVTGKPEEAVQRWIDGFNVFFPAMVTGGLGGGIASLASARGENKVFTKDEEDEINGALSSALEEVEIPNVLRNVQRGMDATKKVYEGPTPVLNGQPAALEPDLVDANGRPLRTETARQKPGFMRTASDLVDLRKADEAEGPGIIQQPGVPSAPRESTTYPKQSMFVVRKKGEGPVPEAPVMGDVIVENKPLATAKGKPFKTEANARKRMQKLGFTPETHDVLPVEGGFVIQEKGRTIPGSDIQPGVSKGSSLFKNGKRRTAGGNLRPAVRTASGIKAGEVGQTHNDLVDGTPENTRGFVDGNGNWYSRSEASEYLKQNDPAKYAALSSYAKKKLHSEDLAQVSGIAIPEKPAMPSQPKTASVKMMITRKDKADLRNLGYTDEDIYTMKPEDAGRILEAKAPKVPEAASKPVNPRALREIDKAVRKGRTDEGTARLARHLLTLDPSFDTDSSLEISNAVRKADPEIVRREGLDPTKSYTIMGQTLPYHEGGVLRTAISLYKGHDADTLVEEWYHRYYERLTPQEQKAYRDYHKASGDARSHNEHFAQEGRDFFFSDKLHEKAGGIRQIFEKARDTLKAMIGRIRVLRGANVPEKIQAMYRSAGSRYEEVTGKARGRKTVSHQIRKGSDQTDTPEFKRWFGNSKVVDENGKPLVVYHGTSSFNEFAKTHAFSPELLGALTKAESAKKAFFFAGSKGTATEYAGMEGVEPPFRAWGTEPSSFNELLGDLRYALFSQKDRGNLAPKEIWDWYGNLMEDVFAAKTGEERRNIIAEYTDPIKNEKLVQKIYYKLEDFWDRDADADYIEDLWRDYGKTNEEGDLLPMPEPGTEEYRDFREEHDEEITDYQSELAENKYGPWIGLLSNGDRVPPYQGNERMFDWDRDFNPTDFRILPVYLKLKNPLIKTFEGEYRDEKFADLLDKAKANGNDGVIFKNVTDGGGVDNIYAVFDPTQIKSVDNTGTFDPKNPDIRYQLRAVTDTPEFKKWFGDSKVVDKNGKPLVVYHGTTRKFDSFSPRMSSKTTGNVTGSLGFFFTHEYAESDRYAKWNGDTKGTVMPTYLSIQNPFRMTYTEFNDLAMLPFNRMKNADFKFSTEDVDRWQKEAKKTVLKRKEELIANGYDGIIVKTNSGTLDEYIAFSPTQIKSVDNQGTFDPDNPDIRYQIRKGSDQTDTPEFKRWFGNSKVVDENGKPLVVYHGSVYDFNSFSNKYADLGSHFAVIPEVSNIFTHGTGSVYPAYLSIKNPLRLEDKGVWEASKILPQMLDRGVITQPEIDAFWENHPKQYTTSGVSNDYLIGLIKNKGYDGIVYLNRREIAAPGEIKAPSPDPRWERALKLQNVSDAEFKSEIPDASDAYIAFEPTQIKSAMGNTGSFDSNNPDIRYQLRKQEPLVNKNTYEPHPNDEGMTETSYQIRLFNEDKDVDVKPITKALMEGRKIGAKEQLAWQREAAKAGVSRRMINKAIKTFQTYNKMKDHGPVVWLPSAPDQMFGRVVVRIGVLNTPAVEGIRAERVDKVLSDVKEGKRSSETGALFEGGEERTGIPKRIRGFVPAPFVNIPITQPRLQKAPPADFHYPMMLTGNPHIDNFKRPNKAWDKFVKVVRVKPVLGGNAKVNNAVINAIKYAKETGARVLVTTFRAKQPWVLAKYTDFVPTDPKSPEFDTYWKDNPNPKPTDARKTPDWTPYVPRNQKVSEAFRKNGWDLEKNIYGSAIDVTKGTPKAPEALKSEHGTAVLNADGTTWTVTTKDGEVIEKTTGKKSGIERPLTRGDAKRLLGQGGGTWWWPKSKELDPKIKEAIGDTPIEYCDLMHQGCPSCRNCQKLTYPESAGAPIIGVTDEPFCEHGCPQCFVRLGQSGVTGRKGISIGQNAKQAGFGQPDLGDIYKGSIDILQGVVRPVGSGKVDYVAKFLHGTPAEKIDAAMSLFIDGKITPEQFNVMRKEIGDEAGSIVEQAMPAETASYQIRAWHGSPSEHDKFSTDYIGTGEGTAAYGYGLYFASKKSIGKYYQKALGSKAHTMELGNTKYSVDEKYAEASPEGRVVKHIFDSIDRGCTPEFALSSVKAVFKNSPAEMDVLKDVNTVKIYSENKGHLYEVELAPDDDEYLLWDEPLSEQSEKVKAALGGEINVRKKIQDEIDSLFTAEEWEDYKRILAMFQRGMGETTKEESDRLVNDYYNRMDKKRSLEMDLRSADSGEGLYRSLSRRLSKPQRDEGWSKLAQTINDRTAKDKAASEYLHSLGIRGIKYLDGTSRGKGAGSYNYVIFSDEDVSIKARFQLRESGRVVTYTELEEHEIPEETQVVYKLMRITGLSKKHLLPLYARPEEGPVQGFEIGKWYKAESQRPSIGGRLLAHRPGIHAVDLPIFSQGRAKVKGEKRVWVEALMPAMDPKTQAESDATPALPNGQRQGIRERVIGPNEAYNFRTNPSATGAGAWPIAGSMKIGRLLSDEDVERILRDHGAQEHIENSLTGVKPDMVERMNAKGSFQLRESDGITKAKGPDAWYSSLAKAVESPKFPGRAPAKQIADILKSWAKSGEIKQEELDWSGILDRLAEEKDDARWTKDMVLEYLRENNVQIEEVMKGGQTAAESENVAKIAGIIEQYDADISDKIYELWKDGRNYEAIDGLLYQFYDKAPEEAVNQVDDLWVNGVVARASKEPRHARWVLPGGKNYRELLLTMPAKARASNLEEAFRQWKADAHAGKRGVYSPKEIDNMTLGDVENILLEEYMRPQRGNEFYNRTHFDEPNILTHVRFNERTDADGKRVLFLEEIQSDWHQQGREKGYQLSKKEFDDIKEKTKGLGDLLKNGSSSEYATVEFFKSVELSEDATFDDIKAKGIELQRKIEKIDKVPDAPFKKTWPMLAFKRMVRWAAENGFDRIAWTTGEQQAARYDMGEQVKQIRYIRNENGTYDVWATNDPEGGGSISPELDKMHLSPKDIESFVGKDMARKIINNEGREENGDMVLEGGDLRLGGEGMKGFYDQILPAEVNKFFNKGKWGNAKVGETSIRESAPDRTWTVIDEDGNESLSFGRKEDAEEYLEYKGWIYGSVKPPSPGTSRVHSLDITPQMREKALSEGMPMFQLREAKGPDVEEVKSIFEDKGIAPRPVQKKGKVSLFARNVARAVQVRPREILKKESPKASFEPVRRYEQTISDERSMASNWMTDFDEALAGLSRADRKWALAGFKGIYEKGEKMPNPRLQKFADAWDRIQNEIGNMAIRFGIREKYRVTEYVVKKGARSVRVFDTEKEAGAFIAESKNADALTIIPRDSTRIRVFTKIRNYFPHILTPEAREALRTQRGELYDALVKAAHTAGFDLTPYMEDLDVKNMVRRNANLENARQARLPSFVETSQGRVQVLEMDPFKVLPSIIEGASRRLAFVKNWSPRPGEALKMHETIRNNIAHESGSENAFVWDYLWQDMQGRTLDEFYNGLSGDIRQVLNTGATIANSAMLTGAQVTNLIVGPLPGMSRFGTWNMTKSASRLLAHKLFRGKMAKTAAELDRFRREGGWAKETMSFTGETEDVHKSIGGMASNFLKLTGMEAANRFLNKMSNFAANYALADAIAGLRNPRTGAFRKAWGMDPGGLREFLKKEGEWTDADIDRMVQDGVTPEDHARFIQKSSTNTNIYRERANTRPEFMARNGFWRRVFSFTSPLRMVGSTVADAVNYAKKGNMRPLITLIIGAPLLGLANNDVKDFLKGVIKKEDENKDDLNTFAGKVLDALAESGIMGMPGSVVSDIRWWAKKGGAPLTIPAAEWWGDLSYGMYRAATKGYSEGLDEGAKQAYYTMIKKVPIFRAIDHQVGGPYTQYLERYRNGGARRQRARRPRRSRRESR